MDEVNLLALLGAGLALVVYVPLTISVFRGTTRQNFATWALWGLLDGIAAGSILLQNGNWWQPAIYVLGCALVCAGVLRTGTFKWTRIETFTTVLVAACVVIWVIAGSAAATVVSTLAVITAGAPQLQDIWKKPEESALWVWATFMIANSIATAAGKNWSIEERFYPATMAIYCFVFVLLTARKWLRMPTQAIC